MTNPIQKVIEFNMKAGFITKESNFSNFRDVKESAYLIEEALEPYGVDYLADSFKLMKTTPEYLKNPQREVAKAILANTDVAAVPTKVQLVDKYVDAIIYAIGSLGKMGLTHQDISAAINIVTEANMKKTLNPVYDDDGKLLKPADWDKYDPEYKLLNLIDKRGL